ncbi:MAG: hypothetical protein CR967_02075 [Proteobacteria bacterium]|nr:MAG: hypothetical protein CR967_02075 [Pseudomonadota bacterium]
MSLAKEMESLKIKAFCKMRKSEKPCLVLGNLLSQKTKFNQVIYHLSPISPISDNFENLEFFSKYEVGSEDGVLALLLNFCHVKSDKKLEQFLENLDVGYISAECSIGEEEMRELALKIDKQKIPLYICGDLDFHERAENIAKLLSMCEYYCDFDIVYEKLSKDLNEQNLHIADEVEELESYDGAVVHFVDGNEKLFGSLQFALANKIKNNDKVLVKTKDGELARTFIVDDELKGTISFLEDENHKNAYAYEVSKITRIANG